MIIRLQGITRHWAVRLAAAMLCAAVAMPWLMDVTGLAFQTRSPLYLATLALVTGICYLAFGCADKRLNGCGYGVGFFLALCLMIGAPLIKNDAFQPLTLVLALAMLIQLAALTAVLGAGTVCLYRLLIWIGRKSDARKQPTTGALWRSGLVSFIVVLGCWIPVWLTFYPGTFRYDAATQFYSYMDGMLGTQHPLAHTLMMSWLMDVGGDADTVTGGLALYSVIQMALMAGAAGYACAWLAKNRAHIVLRIALVLLYALFPLYPLWSFCATKDVLFAGFVLLMAPQLIDLWRERLSWWRAALYVLTTVMMMLFRNNGVYALCLALPLFVLWAKGRRVRVTALTLAALGLFALCNTALVNVTEAESGSPVEIISIPLQQMARVAAKDGDTQAVEPLQELYEEELATVYWAQCADAVKWNLDEQAFFSDPAAYLKLWLAVGLKHPVTYLEAFFVQNLPYFYPGAGMVYNIVLGVNQMEMYPIEERCYLPALRPVYEEYDRTLTVLDVPPTRMLSDCALMAWGCIALLGLAVYRRNRGMMAATAFLLAIWATCLMGPIAVMRYVLALFYCVPLLMCYAASGGQKPAEPRK